MATIIREYNLSSVVDLADIVVLEKNNFEEFDSRQIPEGDPIRVLLKSSKWTSQPSKIEGRMFRISDEKNVAIFCCLRKFVRMGTDPLLKFLPLLVSVLTQEHVNYSFGLDMLQMSIPSAFSGVVVMCVTMTKLQEQDLEILFAPWPGTVYLINLAKENSDE